MPKKEKYRLQALLKIKERAKQRAEIALARAIKELEEEKLKLKKLEALKEELLEKKKKVRTEMADRVATGQSRVHQSQSHLHYLMKLDDDRDRLDREIQDKKDEIEELTQKLKRARRDYIDAATEHNIMEKHKELWKKKELRALNALENKQMNELGNVIHQVNKMR